MESFERKFEIYKWNLYLKTIADSIRDINDLLLHYDKFHNNDFLEKINFLTEKIIDDFSILKKIHNNDTKKLLEILIDFLNNLFDTFKLKRFYNLTPNISYQEYAEMSFWEQILNNIFDWKLSIKEPCLIKKKYIKWWNCHHWSIAIKKIFDRINLDWVDCKINKVPWWHSFIVIEYDSRLYMFDILEQWKFLDMKTMMSEWWMHAYKVMNPEFSDLMEFENFQKFALFTDKNQYHTIRLQIDRIKIEIENNSISIEITKWNKTTKRKFNIFLEKEKNTYTKKQLLEKIFPWISDIIPIISNKIMKEHLTNVLRK